MPSVGKSSIVVTQAIEYSIYLLGHQAHNFGKKSINLEMKWIVHKLNNLS